MTAPYMTSVFIKDRNLLSVMKCLALQNTKLMIHSISYYQQIRLLQKGNLTTISVLNNSIICCYYVSFIYTFQNKLLHFYLILPVNRNAVFVTNTGLEKSAIQSAGTTRFSCRARTFSFSLAQRARSRQVVCQPNLKKSMLKLPRTSKI